MSRRISPNRGGFLNKCVGIHLNRRQKPWVARARRRVHVPGMPWGTRRPASVTRQMSKRSCPPVPGQVMVLNPDTGQVVWRYAVASGNGELDHPSLAEQLPNGNIILNDDYNDHIVVIDPTTNQIVWQCGHRGQPGTAPNIQHARRSRRRRVPQLVRVAAAAPAGGHPGARRVRVNLHFDGGRLSPKPHRVRRPGGRTLGPPLRAWPPPAKHTSGRTSASSPPSRSGGAC